MFNEPRNWKWMVPMGAAVVFMVLFGQMGDWGAWSNIWLGLAIICGLAGAMNLLLYAYAHAAEMIVNLRQAQFSTPEVRMFEAAKGMHPDAVKFLLTQRRTVWRIKYVPITDLVDWVLDEAPSVHVGFVEFVLEHSSSDALMPISMLSEGAFTYDPDKLVTDRQQYNDLLMLMQQKFMATQAYGNQSAKWISPWGPETIRRRFGLDEGMMAAAPEEEVLIPSEIRAAEWKEARQDPIDKAMGELDQTAWMRKSMEANRR